MCKLRLSLLRVIDNLISRLVSCLLNAISSRNWRCSSVILAFYLTETSTLCPWGFLCVQKKIIFKVGFYLFLLALLGLVSFGLFVVPIHKHSMPWNPRASMQCSCIATYGLGVRKSSKNLPFLSCLGVEDWETAQMNERGGAQLVSQCQRSDWLVNHLFPGVTPPSPSPQHQTGEAASVWQRFPTVLFLLRSFPNPFLQSGPTPKLAHCGYCSHPARLWNSGSDAVNTVQSFNVILKVNSLSPSYLKATHEIFTAAELYG